MSKPRFHHSDFLLFFQVFLLSVWYPYYVLITSKRVKFRFKKMLFLQHLASGKYFSWKNNSIFDHDFDLLFYHSWNCQNQSKINMHRGCEITSMHIKNFKKNFNSSITKNKPHLVVNLKKHKFWFIFPFKSFSEKNNNIPSTHLSK